MMSAKDWISTKRMCESLGVSRTTLTRLKADGYLRETQHFRKSNPAAKGASKLVWHETRTLMRMGRI